MLGSAVADEGGLRDDLRGYVVEHLGDPGAVLVVDETGDVKKARNADVGITILMTTPWLCRARVWTGSDAGPGSQGCGITGS
jgi:hypothetical protein